MKTLRVNVHSFVDVITNSSTVIYVQCTNETTKLAKDLIDTILKAANVKQTAIPFLNIDNYKVVA